MCICDAYSPFSPTIIVNHADVEEASIGTIHGDNASVAETVGAEASAVVTYNFDSDDGRLFECGEFPIVSSPDSAESPLVHLSRYYFMLDGRVYWTRSPTGGRSLTTKKTSVDVKVEKLQSCGVSNIPNTDPAHVQGMEGESSMARMTPIDHPSL
jgi:hypothetical protein